MCTNLQFFRRIDNFASGYSIRRCQRNCKDRRYLCYRSTKNQLGHETTRAVIATMTSYYVEMFSVREVSDNDDYNIGFSSQRSWILQQWSISLHYVWRNGFGEAEGMNLFKLGLAVYLTFLLWNSKNTSGVICNGRQGAFDRSRILEVTLKYVFKIVKAW